MNSERPLAVWVIDGLYAVGVALLAGLAVGLFLLHYVRDPTGSELLPLSSFIVLLSYSAHAISWARVGPDLESAARLRAVYTGALLLFAASLFNLFAAVLVWLPQTVELSVNVDFVLSYLHALLFGAGLALSAGGLLLLLGVARGRLRDRCLER